MRELQKENGNNNSILIEEHIQTDHYGGKGKPQHDNEWREGCAFLSDGDAGCGLCLIGQ